MGEALYARVHTLNSAMKNFTPSNLHTYATFNCTLYKNSTQSIWCKTIDLLSNRFLVSI